MASMADREDISLQERHQQFQQIHEYAEQHRHERHRRIHGRPHADRHEDHARQAQNHRMSGHHVGEQTDHQRERLRENPDQLDRRHHRHGNLEPCGYFGPENLLPVLPRSEQVHGKERTQRKHQRHGDVARYVRPAREERDQPHQVVDENEEEHRQQIGREPFVIPADATLDQIVVDHHHEHLHRADESFRHGFLDRPLLVPSRYAEHDADQNQTVKHQRESRFRDRQIERSDIFSVDPFDDLALVRSLRRDPVAAVLGPVSQTRRHEDIPAPRLASQNHRKRHAQLASVPRRDMPLVRVADMPEDDPFHIDRLARPALGGRCGQSPENEQAGANQYVA